jgi:hypothetical protein
VTASAQDFPQKIQRLRPLRVLLAFRDRRYMRVTCFLLERRGYEVVQEGGARIVDAAHRCRADVVLFEPDPSRGLTARTVAALAALPTPPAAIAIVDDDPETPLAGLTSVSKWAPLDELTREIDAASLRRGQGLASNTSSS